MPKQDVTLVNSVLSNSLNMDLLMLALFREEWKNFINQETKDLNNPFIVNKRVLTENIIILKKELQKNNLFPFFLFFDFHFEHLLRCSKQKLTGSTNNFRIFYVINEYQYSLFENQLENLQFLEPLTLVFCASTLKVDD